MPKLYIPIFFGQHSVENHLIICWAFEGVKMITGAMNGEIIIWKNYKPDQILYPHITHQVGACTCMLVMKRPFAEFQDSRISCIITTHEDKRLRMWSVQDGKLLSISDHDQFPYTKTITYMQPIGERDSRYVLCFGKGKAIYVYDLWKMCCSKIFQIADDFDSPEFLIAHQVQQDFAFIDSKSRIYKLDPSIYRDPVRQEYMKYIEKVKQQKPKLQQMRMISVYSLKGLPQRKILNSLYNSKADQLVIVYSRQLVIINDPFKESEQQKDMLFISSSNEIVKFKNVHLIRHKYIYYLIEQVDGSINIIQQKDIDTILKLSNTISINLSFKNFNYLKQPNQQIGILQLNLKNQFSQKCVDKYYNQNGFYVKDKIIRRNQNSFFEYDLDSINLNLISICSQQQDEINSYKISSDGVNLYLNINSVYIDDMQCDINLFYNEIQDDQEQNNKLDYFMKNSEEQYKDLIISCYCIGLYNQYDLFVCFGTQCGKIIVIPYFKVDKKSYQAYVFKTYKQITSIYFIKNSLFAQDDQFCLYVFSFSSIFGKFDYQKCDFNPSSQIILPNIIQRQLRIRKIEQYNQTFSKQDSDQIHRRYVKNLSAFLLSDNSIFVYHNILNEKKYILQNVLNSNEDTLIFYIPIYMYFLIVRGEQISIFNLEKGQYERTVSLDYLTNLFNLEAYLENQMTQLLNLNDYQKFKDKNQQVSQFDLLEYSNRNFDLQIDLHQLSKLPDEEVFYENLGLLSKLQNQLSISDIIYILFYDPAQLYYKSKSTMIFQLEQQEYSKLFRLQSIYLSQNRFQRLNKYFKLEYIPSKQYLIWFDCRKNVDMIQKTIESSTSQRLPLSYTNFYIPHLTQPVFKTYFGCQGMSQGVSRQYKCDFWQASGLMGALYSIGAQLSYRVSSNRNPLDMVVFENSPSLLSLARFALDKDRDVIDISCQMISNFITIGNDLLTLHKSSKDFIKYFDKNKKDQNTFYSLEIMCLVLQVYMSQQIPITEEMNLYILNRILSGISQYYATKQPNIFIVCLKLLNDGIQQFHKCITTPRSLLNVLFLQFYYYVNTVTNHRQLLNDIQSQYASKKSKDKEKDKEKMELFRLYQGFTRQQIKRQRQMLKQVLLTLINHFYQDFLLVIKEYLTNYDLPLVQNTVIDLVRQVLIKQQREQKDLVYFMDIIIKLIDQSNPSLRKQTYSTLLRFINSLDEKYSKVTYSSNKHKIALSNEALIQLYDLRYGVKLSSLDRYQNQISCLKFDRLGKQLASFSYKDQNIKVFQLKPANSFLQNYENVYIKLSHQYINIESPENSIIEWDDDCKYLYLQSEGKTEVFLIE